MLKCVIAVAFGKQTQADKMLASACDSGQQGSPLGGVGACLMRETQSRCWPRSFQSRLCASGKPGDLISLQRFLSVDQENMDFL